MLHHAVCTSACVVLRFKQFIYSHENMDNQNHCMSIKQARLIVNAHKHNLLINSFLHFGKPWLGTENPGRPPRLSHSSEL